VIQNTIFLPDNNGFLERFINKKTELKTTNKSQRLFKVDSFNLFLDENTYSLYRQQLPQSDGTRLSAAFR
jgi:hypothetical protein